MSAIPSEAEFRKLAETWTLHQDGSQEYRYYKELTLFTHTAMNSTYGQTFITYNPDFQELKIHSAYVKQKDGTTIQTPDNAFVEVNCAAIPSELIESELFGHEKGSFTSAIKQKKGKFELANGGTLFLDEIGDMSLNAQAKVLRALQEQKITRVGGDADINVDVRVIAATNKNLKEEIKKGNFREDLYHRLSVIIIDVPPLCQRLEDIDALANHFLTEVCTEMGIAPKTLSPDAIAALKECEWTGNIRELRNVVERLVILCGNTITREDVKMYR